MNTEDKIMKQKISKAKTKVANAAASLARKTFEKTYAEKVLELATNDLYLLVPKKEELKFKTILALIRVGESKIQAIKAVREITSMGAEGSQGSLRLRCSWLLPDHRQGVLRRGSVRVGEEVAS